jgi:hypothetical protein
MTTKKTREELFAAAANPQPKDGLQGKVIDENANAYEPVDTDDLRAELATQGLRLYATRAGLCVGTFEQMEADLAADAAAPNEIFVWFKTDQQQAAQRCFELQNKAGNVPSGESVTFIREDYHSFPTELWGVPVGAGRDAGTNSTVAVIEGIRQSVMDGTNQYLTPEEMAEAQGYFSQAVRDDINWWYDEQGEIARGG